MIMELVQNCSFTVTTTDSKQSRLRRLKNGVLQESVLALLLFNIYTYNLPSTAPTTSHLNVLVQSPSLHWGGLKWLVNSPRISSLGNSWPFLLAASTVLLKHGGLLKSQMPSRNAERHLQRHTFFPKKTVRTISLSVDIPPL